MNDTSGFEAADVSTRPLEPGSRPRGCRKVHSFRPNRRGGDGQRRARFLVHHLEFHGGLDESVERLARDEVVLDFLAFGPFERQRRAIEAWLLDPYTAGTGPYADPAIRRRSALARRSPVTAADPVGTEAGGEGEDFRRRIAELVDGITMRVVLERDATGVHIPRA
ncbi:hypothetical protein [Streptacidiphilus sp. PAMC 29251]